nr:EOG090X04G9 [Polyphemus pediculus]
MAQDEQHNDSGQKKKNQTKENKDPLKPKERPPSKVIIRRLPPTMTEEVFLEQISPIPENDYFYFVKGEYYVGVPTFSRAYINFVNQEDIFTFQDKFDGYVFLDQRGTEYPAVVEFAQYQKIPKQQDSKEDKCNTLDTDPHYVEFLKKLENPDEVTLPSAESYLEQLEQKERDFKANGHSKVLTPLVEFIHQRRLDREKYREEKKEERRRKDIEKKRSRDVERIKKRDPRKDRDERKIEKTGKEREVRPKKEEERLPIRVLKNTDREAAEKLAEHGAIKKPREVVRPKEKERKERAVREKPNKPRSQRGESTTNESKEAASSPSKKVVKEEGLVRKEESNPALSQSCDEPKETEKERRIRNKDRPAIQIYRPGSKRLSQKPENDNNSAEVKREVKTRTFTRSAAGKE